MLTHANLVKSCKLPSLNLYFLQNSHIKIETALITSNMLEINKIAINPIFTFIPFSPMLEELRLGSFGFCGFSSFIAIPRF